MEYFDVVDKNRVQLNYTKIRGENLEENDELLSTGFAAKLMHSYKQSVSGLVRPYADVFAELEKGL